MRVNKIQPEEILPLILCAAGTLGILPFAVMRLSQGEWLIGFVDALIVVSMAALGIFVFRTHKVRPASIYLSILCTSGALLTVYLKGPMQVFWTYPALMVGFYLLKPKEALALVMVATLALLPPLVSQMAFSQLGAVLVTLLITNSVAYSFSAQTRRQKEQLMELAACDPLTGTGNRRGLLLEMQRVQAQRNRLGTPSSLLLIDLDRFKQINDQHGHGVGDEVLIEVCRRITARIRQTDSLYRIGGEEFVVITHNEHIRSAAALAEELRKEVAEVPCSGVDVTLSVGVAELVSDETSKEWLGRADEALYDAKARGRNQVCLARFPHERDATITVTG
ncbi:MAG: GGDEF domain-containing protein [Pseudomonadota bacterium]